MTRFFKFVSSNGEEVSTANQNLVSGNGNGFHWKRITLLTRADCTIIINQGRHDESTIRLISALQFNYDQTLIYSLRIVEPGITYYYNAGY